MKWFFNYDFFFYLEVFALTKKMNDFDHKFEGPKVWEKKLKLVTNFEPATSNSKKL